MAAATNTSADRQQWMRLLEGCTRAMTALQLEAGAARAGVAATAAAVALAEAVRMAAVVAAAVSTFQVVLRRAVGQR